MASNHAVLELPNNFISPTQMIGGNQIPTIKFGVSVAPTDAPDFRGQIYFSKYNGDAFLYIANGNTVNDWEAIYFPSDRGDVFKGKANNFVDSLQTILTRQITTVHFIDDETPQSIPNFAGQLIVSRFGGKYTLFVAIDGANWTQLSGDGGTMPDVSNLAKLDASNDFKEIQSVNGNAIVTVINGTDADPNGKVTPAYPGQLYIYEDETNSTTDYYISDANGGWDMINEEINTANFAKHNIANNFELSDQKILQKQIVSVIVKAVPPNEQPNFVGQLYLDTSKTENNVFIAISRELSPDSANWVSLNLPNNLPDEVVREDLTNDFTVQRQQINGNQIASVVYASTPPPAADSQHLGRVHIENDGTNIKAYFCVPSGALDYEYKPITAEIGSEYVKRDEANNFVALDVDGNKVGQSIHGKPVMSVYVRGALPSAVTPEYPGQLYIYRKLLTDGSGEYDTAMWIADNNAGTLQWTPLQRDLSGLFFRKDIENKITWPVQIMQMNDDTDSIEYIMGAKRIKGLPTALKPSRVGEVVISEVDFEPPAPSIYRVYVALSNVTGDWLKISDNSVDIIALNDRVEALEQSKNDHALQIASLETNLDTHETQLSDLGTHKDTHAAQIATLISENETQDVKLLELQTSKNTQQGEIDTLTTKVNDHGLRIPSVENSIRDINNEINDQKTVVNAGFNNRINDNMNEISDLDGRVLLIEPFKTQGIVNLELDPSTDELIGKNMAGEVVCELALPRIPGLVTTSNITLSRVRSKIITLSDIYTTTVVYTPAESTVKACRFTSSDETVATVSENGVVEPVGIGDVTITATYIRGELSSSIRILVDGDGLNYTMRETPFPYTSGLEVGGTNDTYAWKDIVFPANSFCKTIYVGVTGYTIGNTTTGRMLVVDPITGNISDAYSVNSCQVIAVDGTEGIAPGQGITQQLRIRVPDGFTSWMSERMFAIKINATSGKGMALVNNDGSVTNGYYSTTLPSIGANITFGNPSKVALLAFETYE